MSIEYGCINAKRYHCELCKVESQWYYADDPVPEGFTVTTVQLLDGRFKKVVICKSCLWIIHEHIHELIREGGVIEL